MRCLIGYAENIRQKTSTETVTSLLYYKANKISIGKKGPPEWAYIAGQRKLKFQVTRAGSRLERQQNTLIMSDQNQNELHSALLEVELLDTLANVDPPQALARIAHLNLPADHPVFQAATAAVKDARQARILSDLLIELTIGIDADIARQLVRTPEPVSRRRRRRR